MNYSKPIIDSKRIEKPEKEKFHLIEFLIILKKAIFGIEE
jgi:hypothetical protein